ncbi:peptidoglycan recognition protein [Papilio machaon]|uniref:peptidoglycan recognition protein n=1 Tax=Papilio machaon TaxID=76193 RepID=UPI001E6645A5|nr:peptidoglycan recognition protein [Papilio machaon]
MSNFFLLVTFGLHQIFSTSTAFIDASCGVVPIWIWGCESTRRTVLLDLPVKIVVIQHTVSPPCNNDHACESSLKSIRDYHINHLNFTDIGPSFLIGGNGKVYEGAGWKHVGAHTRGYNDKAIAVSFIGDFSYDLPTPEALQAAEDLLSCGVKNYYLTPNYRIVGHRQLSATDSPGDKLQEHISTWSHWTYAL